MGNGEGEAPGTPFRLFSWNLLVYFWNVRMFLKSYISNFHGLPEKDSVNAFFSPTSTHTRLSSRRCQCDGAMPLPCRGRVTPPLQANSCAMGCWPHRRRADAVVGCALQKGHHCFPQAPARRPCQRLGKNLSCSTLPPLTPNRPPPPHLPTRLPSPAGAARVHLGRTP